MDYQEEIRILREQTTALQWALAATLGSCQRIGEESQVNEMTLDKIQSLKKAVQNLSIEEIRIATGQDSVSSKPPLIGHSVHQIDIPNASLN